MEVYRFDLRNIFVPEARATPKIVLALICNLPLGSRFYAERRGGQQFRGWDESRYASVGIINAVRALQYTYIYAHSKKKPAIPEPYPTPDVKAKASSASKPGSFANVVAKSFAAARKRKAGG